MNEHFKLVIVGFILWIGENMFFGWNEKPMSISERVFDIISLTMIIWGIVGDIARGITYKKEFYITTDKTIINKK